MLKKRYIKSIKRDIFVLISCPVFQFLFCYILERKDKKWFKRDIIVLISFLILFVLISFSGKYWKRNGPSGVLYDTVSLLLFALMIKRNSLSFFVFL